MGRIQLSAVGLEFEDNGNTIWVHGEHGTLLRIKCSGQIRVKPCAAPVAHADVNVPGDIEVCVPAGICAPGTLVGGSGAVQVVGRRVGRVSTVSGAVQATGRRAGPVTAAQTQDPSKALRATPSLTQDPSKALRATPSLTHEERQELREAALRALERSALQPWRLQSSNSFRRIGSRGDGDVLQAVVQRHDGQPDLLGASGVLDYIVAAQPRVVLALLAALRSALGEDPL